MKRAEQGRKITRHAKQNYPTAGQKVFTQAEYSNAAGATARKEVRVGVPRAYGKHGHGE